MIDVCYSSTNALGETLWTAVQVEDTRYDYLTQDPALILERAEQGRTEGWLTVIEL
jgi:hypothetical protein